VPFKSKAQQRWMFAAEARGELPEGTAKEWAHETKNFKKLPERVKKTAGDKHPDLPQYTDPESAPWTKGTQESGAFQKAAGFAGGFWKTAGKNLAGTTDEAIRKYNEKAMETMRAKKPLFKVQDIKALPKSFVKGLAKAAEASMSMEANQQSGWSIGDEMPGTALRNNAETGQFKGKSLRTEGVQNEGKEFNQKFKQKAQTARGGKHYGGSISTGMAENREP
jgi:hypothetical protein